MPDPFDLSDEGTDEPTDSENKNFVQLRQHARDLEKRLKSVEPELEELRGFRTQTLAQKRTDAAENAFKELSLNPASARLFTALNPEGDVTVEAVAAFAKENGLMPVDAATPAPVADGPAPVVDSPDVTTPSTDGQRTRGFQPQVGGATVPVDAEKVSRAEWLRMVQDNPAKAQSLFEQNRVDMSDVAWAKPYVAPDAPE